MRQISKWEAMVTANPDHSHWFVQRFRAMAAAGEDLHGEARIVDAMVGRGARILDAGCGSGRVGGHLMGLGHDVVGVDVDPVLVEAAREDYPGGTWLVGDLIDLDLPAGGYPEPFDLIVCAGNTFTFLAPGTEVAVLRRMAGHLGAGGRIAIGFGAGRGLAFETYREYVAEAGLRIDSEFSSWDLRPLTGRDDFLVTILSKVPALV